MYNFINPYNFIPFEDGEPQKTDKRDIYRGESGQKELLSGWFDVSMYIKTPLVIPDGAHPRDIALSNKDKHKEYDFLKMYNPLHEKMEYAVPGSELRGLIRSTYETVTNSCIPFLMHDKPVSQRVPLYGALNRRGLLGYDGKKWILYSTTKELEEVIVVPIYKVNGKYYIEKLEKIKNYKDNNKLDKNGNHKYQIMDCLNIIENSLKGYKYKNEKINLNAEFVKRKDNNKKEYDVKIFDETIEECIDKKSIELVRHLLVNAKGEVLEKKTGTYVEEKGWLQYNVPVDTSRVYHIAYLKEKENEKEYACKNASDAEVYKKLKSALERDEVRNSVNSNKDSNYALREALERACAGKKQLVPVYYFKVKDGKNEIVYMSGSAAGRIAQRRKWKEIMEGHTPCDNKLCPACLLFGTIKDGGMKGHVRFTDSFLTDAKTPKTSRHILKVLASPRTTAFEFYLKKPERNATFWNYDFYGVTEENNNGEGHTNYYHLEKAMPRGRKMYWHHKVSADDMKPTKLNNTVESLDEGIFKFRVYFDQITKTQLQDLMWVVELGDNNKNSKFQHKLGHAKPLGYGSVKLVIDDGKIRKFARTEEGYSYELADFSKANIDVNMIKPSFDTESEPVKDLLIMANVEAVADEVIDYPRTREGGNIYEWFSENRKNAKNLQILPEPNAVVGSIKRLKIGDVVDARFVDYAEKKGTDYKFGIYVEINGGIKALLHRNDSEHRNLEWYYGKTFKVKIKEINEKKKYSVTDKI